jgi:hypothetical protein
MIELADENTDVNNRNKTIKLFSNEMYYFLGFDAM